MYTHTHTQCFTGVGQVAPRIWDNPSTSVFSLPQVSVEPFFFKKYFQHSSQCWRLFWTASKLSFSSPILEMASPYTKIQIMTQLWHRVGFSMACVNFKTRGRSETRPETTQGAGAAQRLKLVQGRAAAREMVRRTVKLSAPSWAAL